MGMCPQVSRRGEADCRAERVRSPEGAPPEGAFPGILNTLEGFPSHLLLQPVLAHTLTQGPPGAKGRHPDEAGSRGPLLRPSQDVP